MDTLTILKMLDDLLASDRLAQVTLSFNDGKPVGCIVESLDWVRSHPKRSTIIVKLLNGKVDTFAVRDITYVRIGVN